MHRQRSWSPYRHGSSRYIYIVRDSVAAKNVDLGLCAKDTTTTFYVVNTATGTLQTAISVYDDTPFVLNKQEVAVAAGDSIDVDLTFVYADAKKGRNTTVISFKPSDDRVYGEVLYVDAIVAEDGVWQETFNGEGKPKGWFTEGWQIKDNTASIIQPSDGMEGMMGGGASLYYLMTPVLTIQNPLEVLAFSARTTGDSGMGSFMGGGGSGMLQVYYQREHETEWTLYDVFTQGGTIYIEAPYAGVYRLKFKSPGVSLDNFKGFFTPMEEVALVEGEDANNTAMLEKYDGIKVNVTYDRTLSAVYNSDDTWSPKAYTICLPYDWNVSDYMANDMVKLYQLAYIDKYYKQFIFTECADMAEAGKAYLAVVEKGSVSMNAANVTIKKDIAETDAVIVNDYEKWYFDKEQTKVGTWQGTFSKITAESAADKYIYCLREDGSWGRLVADESDPTIALSAFRGYLQADEEMTEDYSMNPLNDGAPHVAGNSFQTMFGIDGEVTDQPNLMFVGDIPMMQPETTGVKPLIQTIDADGTHRYYDLMGRQMKEKAQIGITIENGKKTLR